MNGWKTKDVIKAVSIALTAGFIYASLTFQVHGLTKYFEDLDSRIDHIEQYITKQSHGDFMRQDPPPKSDPRP